MASKLGTNHSSRIAALFVAQGLVLIIVGVTYLRQFYGSASSDETGWSILFMPIILGFVGMVWAAAALPLLVAFAVRKQWAWGSVPISLVLPFLLADLTRSGKGSGILSIGDDRLLDALQWQLPLIVWVVSVAMIGWLEFLTHKSTNPTSSHSGNHNEQL